MLPGNTSNDATWEKFSDEALDLLSDANLTIEESYMAVRAGIAAVKATREDISKIMKEVRQDERMAYDLEKIEEKEHFERESG